MLGRLHYYADRWIWRSNMGFWCMLKSTADYQWTLASCT